MKKKLAILVSGTGSNMEEIAKNCIRGFINAEVTFVASDKSDAAGLEKARSLGISTMVLPYLKEGQESAEKVLIDKIIKEQVDWLVLAGFMRILSPGLVQKLSGKIVNIHPSLLPALPGTKAIERAWNAGVKITGVTVHLVDEKVDHGPILAQEPVRVSGSETLESLERKIHDVEHRIYSRVLRDLVNRNLSVTEGRKPV